MAGAIRQDKATQPDGSARTDKLYYFYVGTTTRYQYLLQRAERLSIDDNSGSHHWLLPFSDRQILLVVN